MQFQEVKLYNPGILISEIPNSIFDELIQSCETQIENKNISNSLKKHMAVDYSVQGIEESLYVAIPKSYNDWLCDFATHYCKYYGLVISSTTKPTVPHHWLNLQKKYEYRPLHSHGDMSGKNLSFVTYIKVPYDLKEEDSYKNHSNKATTFRNGRIEFLYNSYSGKQYTYRLPIDKSFEGKTIIFPNSLMHLVYPFYTSDDYRISLAGNIRMEE